MTFLDFMTADIGHSSRHAGDILLMDNYQAPSSGLSDHKRPEAAVDPGQEGGDDVSLTAEAELAAWNAFYTGAVGVESGECIDSNRVVSPALSTVTDPGSDTETWSDGALPLPLIAPQPFPLGDPITPTWAEEEGCFGGIDVITGYEGSNTCPGMKPDDVLGEDMESASPGDMETASPGNIIPFICGTCENFQGEEGYGAIPDPSMGFGTAVDGFWACLGWPLPGSGGFVVDIAVEASVIL